MKETGIIMSGDHPKLILEGLKTQTRRVIKPQPKEEGVSLYLADGFLSAVHPKNFHGWFFVADDRGRKIKCPYGQVGDRLWVRETFVIECDIEYGSSDEEIELWRKDRPVKTEDGGFDYGIYHLIPHYRATEPEPNIVPNDVDDFDDRTRWSPSLFMPRWASRILLEITGVRVERLQEITEEDAKAEGIVNPKVKGSWQSWVWAFKDLWNKLNAKRGYGWDKNPWVWVISFKERR